MKNEAQISNSTVTVSFRLHSNCMHSAYMVEKL